VLDDNMTAMDMALIEAREEFLSHYRTQNGSTKKPIISSECPGTNPIRIRYLSSLLYVCTARVRAGWICYAEKREGATLPFIRFVAIIGALSSPNRFHKEE
jgi:hypothetical protein